MESPCSMSDPSDRCANLVGYVLYTRKFLVYFDNSGGPAVRESQNNIHMENKVKEHFLS